MNLVPTGIFDSWDENGLSPLPPGSAQWTTHNEGEPLHRSLIYVCPCGCRRIRAVPVTAKNEQTPQRWNWNGNFEFPTLTPSIRIIGECGWHGWLTNGEWRAC